MTAVSISIAAHPKRGHMAGELTERLDHPVYVAWDRRDDEWDTHQMAWEHYDPDADWQLVLQDDVVPARNLAQALPKILDSVPEPNMPVSLYFGNALNHPKVNRAARTAEANNASWIVSSGIWWGPAVAIPTRLVEEMLLFCVGRREAYDRRLSIWCGSTGRNAYYPWPSLVDHADVGSLVNPGRRPGRRAFQFVGEDYDATSWDPTGDTVQCGRLNGPVRTTLGRD